jgi:SAM-dependent methyltransferase
MAQTVEAAPQDLDRATLASSPDVAAPEARMITIWLALILAQSETAYDAFLKWQKEPENRQLKWDAATAKYHAKLIADGMEPAQADKALSIIASRDEAVLYDPIFRGETPQYLATPNRLLTEAVRNRKPGKALDVGMGQGRNTIHLAKLGWQVTGFDVSKAGLDQAQKLAAKGGVKIQTIQVSDEEFDFGTNPWDLIAIIYPIEKRSIHRVRQALKPGGIVVVECGHKESGDAPFEYDSKELLKIFDGFRILKYEEVVAEHEWARKELRLVRLVAQKK